MTRVDLLWLADYIERHGGRITVPSKTPGMNRHITTEAVLSVIDARRDGEARATFLDGGNTDRFLDTIRDSVDDYGEVVTRDLVEKLLPCLTEMERDIVNRRFGLSNHEEQALHEIGDELGCSKEWVRILEARAIKKLRDKLEEVG